MNSTEQLVIVVAVVVLTACNASIAALIWIDAIRNRKREQ